MLMCVVNFLFFLTMEKFRGSMLVEIVLGRCFNALEN
jgi:hypothetical protein